MFGNILIDKLRISRKIDSNFNPRKVQESLNKLTNSHFRAEHFSVNYDKCYFRVTLTPTLYMSDKLANEGKPIYNMEMIAESTLVSVLEKVYDILGDEAVVTWIDITKNILVKDKASNYIESLSRINAKYPYKKHNCTSKTVVKTAIFGTLKRTNGTDCVKDVRQITFYDKVAEILEKTRQKSRFIDNVNLTKNEIAQLPKEAYQKEHNRLFLRDLNILRIEHRLKYTNNIKRLTWFLCGSKVEDKLKLPLLINLLKKKELYSKLDAYFTSELKNYIFFEKADELKVETLSANENMLVGLIIKHDINLNNWLSVFEDVTSKDVRNNFIKKMQPHLIGKCYIELYKKLINISTSG